jgi:hypothetical protein
MIRLPCKTILLRYGAINQISMVRFPRLRTHPSTKKKKKKKRSGAAKKENDEFHFTHVVYSQHNLVPLSHAHTIHPTLRCSLPPTMAQMAPSHWCSSFVRVVEELNGGWNPQCDHLMQSDSCFFHYSISQFVSLLKDPNSAAHSFVTLLLSPALSSLLILSQPLSTILLASLH